MKHEGNADTEGVVRELEELEIRGLVEIIGQNTEKSPENLRFPMWKTRQELCNTQKNSKCSLSGGRNETVNHIWECNKREQKQYKTRLDRVGKVTHWELCKKLKFVHAEKWHMNKPVNICPRKYDFEIQMNHPILARRPNLLLKKTCHRADFALLAN